MQENNPNNQSWLSRWHKEAQPSQAQNWVGVYGSEKEKQMHDKA